MGSVGRRPALRACVFGLALLGAAGCAAGDGDGDSFGAGLGDGADAGTGGTDGLDPSAGDPDDPEATATATASAGGSEGSGGVGLDCDETPGDPACDCEALDEAGEYVLGPCAAPCVEMTYRHSLWVTVYNVSGTLGYGEHQGLGVIGYRYEHDPRFSDAGGIALPWRQADGNAWVVEAPVAEADQFSMRTMAPGGEHYEDAVLVPEDEEDLYPGETHPLVPVVDPHPVLDGAALCDVPEQVLDARFYNHGRTLAERVPNHEWDSFFGRRDLIPLELLASIEVQQDRHGDITGAGHPEDLATCLDVLDDGFCESRCGNCSYVMPTGFTGTPFAAPDPGWQIQGIPAASNGPYQIGGGGGPVPARVNYSAVEDGRTVWYVGGSSWGRPDETSGYGPADWPDPDGVAMDPDAWMSVAGCDHEGGDGIPDEWEDPFTHCVDAAAIFGSQIPASFPRFVSGRWGHNSNSDAEAVLRHFTDCGDDPVMAADPTWWNEHTCSACGAPRWSTAGDPVQAPCQDTTHTATSYWESAPGLHDIEDLDLGKRTAVGPERVVTSRMSEVPDPICRWSGEPVFGM